MKHRPFRSKAQARYLERVHPTLAADMRANTPSPAAGQGSDQGQASPTPIDKEQVMAIVPRRVTVEIEFTRVGNLIIDLARLIADYHDELPDDLVQKARDLVAVAEEHEED